MWGLLHANVDFTDHSAVARVAAECGFHALTVGTENEFPLSWAFCRLAGCCGLNSFVQSYSYTGLLSSCTRGAIASEMCPFRYRVHRDTWPSLAEKQTWQPPGELGPGWLAHGPRSNPALTPSPRAALHTGFSLRQGRSQAWCQWRLGNSGGPERLCLSLRRGVGHTLPPSSSSLTKKGGGLSLAMESEEHHLSLPAA